jgi:Ran GTPase-activating protein (RanGAP) involved in mRNA processing and transport
MNVLIAAGMNYFNLPLCQLNKNDMELLSYSLHQNPLGNSTLKVLNLSRNAILKEGAKTLAQALEGNKSLEVLDLSQCKLGVSGTYAIAQALLKNSTLKSLNLYRNKVDVDGARSLREVLKVNHSLEFLDVGHNRLREKGIKALTDGICENPNSKLRHLGIRFNFINDDGFNYFFENAIFKNKSKIDHVYLLQNYLSEHYTLQLAAKVE